MKIAWCPKKTAHIRSYINPYIRIRINAHIRSRINAHIRSDMNAHIQILKKKPTNKKISNNIQYCWRGLARETPPERHGAPHLAGEGFEREGLSPAT